MVCDICKKRPATYHSRTNINGRVSEVHLCEECMGRANLNPLSMFADSFFGFSEPSTSRYIPSRYYDLECDKCGTIFSNVLKTGRVGCPDCYKKFRDGIYSAIGTLNYGSKHVGLTPKSRVDTENIELTKLEKKLKEAVESENYEEAAKIKKEITKLKEGGKNE